MSRRKTPSCAGSSDDNSFQWPSTAVIFETPDRKRSRRSIESSSDFGLNTSFGSPKASVIPPSTSPLLKTPVQISKKCIHLTPSPLSSFRVRESNDAKLRLSNPMNATEMRFTGSSLERFSPVKLSQLAPHQRGYGKPLAPIQSNVSRCLNDTFRLDDSAYQSANDSSFLQNSFRSTTKHSDLLETPSKLLKDDSYSFDTSYNEFQTSTPVKPSSSCNFSVFRNGYIPEQPSSRLETCVADTSDFIISPTRYIESPVKQSKAVEKIPVITQPIARCLFPKIDDTKGGDPHLNKLLDNFDPFVSEKDRQLLIKAGYHVAAMECPNAASGADVRPTIRGPFAGKKKRIRPIFTSSEIRQSCAETNDAFDLISQAKKYLKAHPLTTSKTKN